MHPPAVSNLNVMAWRLKQRMTMLGTVLLRDSYLYSTFIIYNISISLYKQQNSIIYILG